MKTNQEETVYCITPRVTDAFTLKEVCHRAESDGFDLGPKKKLWRDIDPKGCHLLTPLGLGVVLSGDEGCVEYVRCSVLAKVKGTMKPARFLVDLLPNDFLGLPEPSL